MPQEDQPVVIVGAGLSGLACALKLQDAQVPFILLEASDAVGGRVRSDDLDGYLLDRGFQVFLDAYARAGELLDLEALDLHAFEPGALVQDGKTMFRVMDVFRRPKWLWSSAMSPLGTWMDKLRVAQLRFRSLRSTGGQIAKHPDTSTEEFLRKFGFSEAMIDGFFRSFYGGIFLENELRTSSRMFEFTFKMFSQGSATLPANGMRAIPEQLAARLPSASIQFESPVAQVSPDAVTLADGRKLDARLVVVATEASATERLVPRFEPQAPKWRAATNLYFAADKSPLNEAIIALNGSQSGLINNLCVPSDVCSNYAPHGKSLVSVTLLGAHTDENLRDLVLAELKQWFGKQVDGWRHLRTDHIKHALPEQAPNNDQIAPGYLEIDGVLICGDHTSSPSIEGAILSGECAAKRVLEML